MSDQVSVEETEEVTDEPLFGDFDDEVVEDVLVRHEDAGASEGSIAFVDQFEGAYPVTDLELDSAALTDAAKDHLEATSHRDIAVGIELPSGRFTVATFEEPDESNWEESRLKRFFESVGTQPASLDEAVGETVPMTVTDGRYHPTCLDGGTSDGQEKFSLVPAMGLTMAVVGFHAAVAVVASSPFIGIAAAGWTVVLGLIILSIHIGNHE